jgi:hypothetical protein
MEGIKRSLKKSPFLWSAAFALLLLGQVLGYMTNFATWLSGLGASLISGMAVAWVWLGILLKAQGPHPLSSDLEVKVRSLQRVATVLFWFGVFGFLTVPNLDTMRASLATGLQAAVWVAILGALFEVNRLEASKDP